MSNKIWIHTYIYIYIYLVCLFVCFCSRFTSDVFCLAERGYIWWGWLKVTIFITQEQMLMILMHKKKELFMDLPLIWFHSLQFFHLLVLWYQGRNLFCSELMSSGNALFPCSGRQGLFPDKNTFLNTPTGLLWSVALACQDEGDSGFQNFKDQLVPMTDQVLLSRGS